jgi:predicted dithiol-disulfide oxidoreductase (DUF899 family)
MHGLGAFLRRGDRVFCTYSSYARGTDMVNSTYQWLDLTPAAGRKTGSSRPGAATVR